MSFVKSIDDLPPYEDYDMQGRTYRYADQDMLFLFGFGLSYTTFNYGNVTASINTFSQNSKARISVDVTNQGGFQSEEVV